MKIGIDFTSFELKKAVGYNSYCQNFLKGLTETVSTYDYNYVLFVREDQVDWFYQYESYRIKILPIRITNQVVRMLWLQLVLPLQSVSYSAILFTANASSILCYSKSVLVIHDLNFANFRKNYTFLRYCYFILTTRLSLITANRVITISKSIKNEIKIRYNVDSRVIYNPVSCNTLVKNTNLCAKLILVPSSLAVHKNIINAFQAAKLFALDCPDVQFVFIGNWNPIDFPCKNDSKNISILGYVDDIKKDALFNIAKIVLVPSTYEGFGLPYIEALSAGKTLICSDIPIAREISEGYAIYINKPYNSNDIYTALKSSWHSNLHHSIPVSEFIKKYSPSRIVLKYIEELKTN